MKIINNLLKATGLAALALFIIFASALISFADDVPTPAISIAVTNTTQLSITITNGVSFANYELYRRPLLNSAYPFALHQIGTLGQTNFVADMGLENQGFFEIAVGNDWDGDGVPNYSDADPSNASLGILSITIDSPTNGSSFN